LNHPLLPTFCQHLFHLAKAWPKEAENLERVFQLFPKLKQFANRYAETLSGGEARMLAIGRGLMSDAKFLALDEPSLGLAPNNRAGNNITERFSFISTPHQSKSQGISVTPLIIAGDACL
jgi:ABC-type branched-subunit amino acid transport system ATPase component